MVIRLIVNGKWLLVKGYWLMGIAVYLSFGG
jgi:hypothetical protein